MSDNYVLKYSNDDGKPYKIMCLGLCILLDLIVLIGILSCFSARKYLDLLIYAAIFAVALAIRISSLFFTYDVVITLRGGNLSVVKKYPCKSITVFDGSAGKLKLQKYDGQVEAKHKKYVRLCSKTCEDNLYMIELLEKEYLIYLDDYMFSLIEVSGDIS